MSRFHFRIGLANYGDCMVQNCPTQNAPHASTLCEYMWDDFRLCLAGVTGFGFGLRLDFHSLKYKHFYRRRFFCCSFHICAVCFVYIFIVCNMAVERKSFMCYCTRQLFHKCGDAVKWLPPIQKKSILTQMMELLRTAI